MHLPHRGASLHTGCLRPLHAGAGPQPVPGLQSWPHIPRGLQTQPTSYSITHTHHWHSARCPGCGTKSSDTQFPTSGLCLPDATQSGQSGHWAALEHSNMVNTVATPLPSLCPTSLLCPSHPTQGTARHCSTQASPRQCPRTPGLTTASLLLCPLFVPVARHQLSTDTN